MNTVKEIMSTKVITMESSVSATDIAKIMQKNNVSSVIITENEKPCGIVTERDLVSKVIAQNKHPSELKTTTIMSSPIITVSPNTTVDEVAEMMVLKKIRRMIVSDGDQILGIITVTDFIKHLHSLLTDEDDYDPDRYKGLIEDWEYWNP